jgi:sulfide dehydrogenase cytochrome subunit
VIINYQKALLVGGLMLGLSQFALAADEKKAKPELMTGASTTMLANACAGCHGANGASNGPGIPSIGGLSQDYFVETMKGYQAGTTPGTIMQRIAKGYSEAEFEQMGKHFSAQKFVAAKGQTVDDKKAGKGEKLHAKYCEKCHEEGGTVDADGTGVLKGQWKPYLGAQITAFMAGEREMGKKMSKKMKKLHKAEGDDGLKALIEYYAK